MTTDARRVMHGFFELSEAERVQVVTELSKYYNLSPQEQAKYVKELSQPSNIKMAVGPLSTPCPCCGK